MVERPESVALAVTAVGVVRPVCPVVVPVTSPAGPATVVPVPRAAAPAGPAPEGRALAELPGPSARVTAEPVATAAGVAPAATAVSAEAAARPAVRVPSQDQTVSPGSPAAVGPAVSAGPAARASALPR
jgi:hypothetical protein